jgi:hypothetical protein
MNPYVLVGTGFTVAGIIFGAGIIFNKVTNNTNDVKILFKETNKNTTDISSICTSIENIEGDIKDIKTYMKKNGGSKG